MGILLKKILCQARSFSKFEENAHIELCTFILVQLYCHLTFIIAMQDDVDTAFLKKFDAFKEELKFFISKCNIKLQGEEMGFIHFPTHLEHNPKSPSEQDKKLISNAIKGLVDGESIFTLAALNAIRHEKIYESILLLHMTEPAEDHEELFTGVSEIISKYTQP